jgi:hypothetical protein
VNAPRIKSLREAGPAKAKDLRETTAVVRPLEHRLEFDPGDQPGRLQTGDNVANPGALMVWQHKAQPRTLTDQPPVRQLWLRLVDS